MTTAELYSTRTGYINTNAFSGFNGEMRIGESDTSRPSFGDFGGIFEIPLGTISGKRGIAKITKIGFDITTTTTDSGYNGCIARIEYLGKNISSDKFVIAEPPLWRVGAINERASLYEGRTNNFLTEDIETCKNFRKLFLEASKEDNHYFRIVRDAKSQGVYSQGSKNVKLIIYYEEANIHYYTDNKWNQCVPYYYNGTEWKQCVFKYHTENSWHQT